MHAQGFWGLLAAEEGLHGGGGGRGRCPKLCSLVHRSATSCAPSPALRLLSTALHKDAATNCALLQHHVQWCSEHWCVGRRHAAWDVATLPAVALHVPHQPRALHVLPLECPPPAPAAWPPCPLNFMSCRAGSLSVSYQACVLAAASLAAIKAHVSPLGWESGGEGRGLSCCWWLECSCSPKAFL